MSSVGKILRKDIAELYYRPYLLAWLLLLPLVFLYLAGEVSKAEPPLRLLFMAGDSEATEQARARRLLSEYAPLTVLEINNDRQDLVTAMDRNDASMALEWRDGWRLYLRGGELNVQRRLSQVANLLSWSFRTCRPWQLDAAAVVTKGRRECEIGLLQIQYLDGAARHTDRALIPQVVALVTAFVPFLLASGALIRERELGTLAVLLSAPGVGMRSLFVGKLLFPVLIAVLVLLSTLLFAGGLYDLPIRPGLLQVGLLQGVGILSSSLLGLAVSARVSNQLQAYLASALYFLCLILLTGFVAPLDTSRPVVWTLSVVLPLTYTQGPLVDWMLSGRIADFSDNALLAVGIQCLCYGVLAAWGFRSTQRAI